MVVVLDDVVEVLIHQDDDILAVGGVDDAAVVAAGVHAAALAGHPDQLRLTGLLTVEVELGEIVGEHGVVVLLTEDGQHLGAGLGADERALRHLREEGGIIPGRRGAEVGVEVKVKGVVQEVWAKPISRMQALMTSSPR